MFRVFLESVTRRTVTPLVEGGEDYHELYERTSLSHRKVRLVLSYGTIVNFRRRRLCTIYA